MTEFLRRGAAGMKSVKDMPVVQDGPPPGGFPAIRYARRVPSTGPGGFTLFAVSAAIMAYGFYQVGQSNRGRRAVRAETMEARASLVPFLQARSAAPLPAASSCRAALQLRRWPAGCADRGTARRLRTPVWLVACCMFPSRLPPASPLAG
jgi:hypothetical protein